MPKTNSTQLSEGKGKGRKLDCFHARGEEAGESCAAAAALSAPPVLRGLWALEFIWTWTLTAFLALPNITIGPSASLQPPEWLGVVRRVERAARDLSPGSTVQSPLKTKKEVQSSRLTKRPRSSRENKRKGENFGNMREAKS